MCLQGRGSLQVSVDVDEDLALGPRLLGKAVYDAHTVLWGRDSGVTHSECWLRTSGQHSDQLPLTLLVMRHNPSTCLALKGIGWDKRYAYIRTLKTLTAQSTTQ